MTLIHERVALARDGQNPTVIGRMASGWAVLGDAQLPLGYSLLLSDPVVFGINDLGATERARFLEDMVSLGDALLAVTSAYRINYEIQCNGDQALHAHVFARYESEPLERRRGRSGCTMRRCAAPRRLIRCCTRGCERPFGVGWRSVACSSASGWSGSLARQERHGEQ